MIARLSAILALFCVPVSGAFAAAAASAEILNLTAHWVGYGALALFVLAYVLVIAEEWLHLRKSIPVLLAAGFIWTLIAIAYAAAGNTELVNATVRHSLLEFAELFFFLLVAMTYINTLEERGIFDALHGWLVGRGFTLRTVFWVTGALAFVISPIADNMTTALVMASVVMAVGRNHPKFVLVACINVVVAANAGGAFSPFGDITTLMVWQKGILPAQDFLLLLAPSLVNWLVPAAIMALTVPKESPGVVEEAIEIKPGGVLVIFMFIATIAITVGLHAVLHMPPVIGMMGGLGLLKLYGYFLNRAEQKMVADLLDEGGMTPDTAPEEAPPRPFNIFHQVARAEWDTLLFFYGIILCVGGLGLIGYLAAASQLMYVQMGPTVANVLVGIFSAIVDNIPVMYAVLTMNPLMDEGQWLLVTLTAGVGGSLLAVGSAAGVAVMGQAHGVYTFFGHLRWTWAIALGYAASIAVHFWVNAARFVVH